MSDIQESAKDRPKCWLNRRSFLGSAIAVFVAGNVYVLGSRNGWWKRRQHLVMRGPFEPFGPIKIDVVGGSHLVDVKQARLITGKHTASLNLRFVFAGDKSKDQRLALKLRVIGEDGKVLHKDERVCNDMRAYAQQSYPSGSIEATIRPINTAILSLPSSIANNAHLFEVDICEAPKGSLM